MASIKQVFGKVTDLSVDLIDNAADVTSASGKAVKQTISGVAHGANMFERECDIADQKHAMNSKLELAELNNVQSVIDMQTKLSMLNGKWLALDMDAQDFDAQEEAVLKQIKQLKKRVKRAKKQLDI